VLQHPALQLRESHPRDVRVRAGVRGLAHAPPAVAAAPCDDQEHLRERSGEYGVFVLTNYYSLSGKYYQNTIINKIFTNYSQLSIKLIIVNCSDFADF
jgi:hypothetical protein